MYLCTGIIVYCRDAPGPVVKCGRFFVSLPPKYILTGELVNPKNPGNVVKHAPDSFLPGMAVFKPFSGTFGSGWYNLSFFPGNAVKSKIRRN